MTGVEVEEVVVVVDIVVLIEMVINLAGTIEIVLKEDQEMTAIIRTFLVPMDVVLQETSVQGRKNTPDSSAIEDTAVSCWSCQSLFCCISSSWFSGWTNLLDQTVDV
ncbi:uncharacterized protein LOC108961156 isoform X1 [Eucalyptus grandis]|uniref:uncharacterized protein LOC108961156 isoform X1 n=1 Tax=Eucalyptus grandis TaxID=71139 RepID=UPI00192EDE2D|nr:uncharacterized protein LOC108961156 isoform X1 [Eucalyptus grandis]XP_039174055.1 uncharacterized protein LOC108961156 isoform X1 [Eucalyptus grandis]XP_039174056.1 uncharacterized protein LOC108961156 isoform X1 [Eucalyptus grandis]